MELRKVLEKHMSVSNDVLSGESVFVGTRVPVKLFFSYLQAGESIEEFLSQYPSVAQKAPKAILKALSQHLTLETTYENSV